MFTGDQPETTKPSEVYWKFYQTLKTKLQQLTFPQKTPSQKFDKVLNLPLTLRFNANLKIEQTYMNTLDVDLRALIFLLILLVHCLPSLITQLSGKTFQISNYCQRLVFQLSLKRVQNPVKFLRYLTGFCSSS